jgi:hypothetical protein
MEGSGPPSHGGLLRQINPQGLIYYQHMPVPVSLDLFQNCFLEDRYGMFV